MGLLGSPAKKRPSEDATSAATIASVARLEAMASLAAHNEEISSDEDFLNQGCRLGYSSVLTSKTDDEAQALLAHIFTVALTRNPEKEIGGMLFYDEQTNALVQVLEGPALAVRELFYQKIQGDPRHTSVKVLWDLDVEQRRFDGFGMRLGSSVGEVLLEGAAADDQQKLLKLQYVSQLTAETRDAAYTDIESILKSAFVTNPKLHIGGALFLNPRTLHVMQVLEGPERAVRTLYNKIALDRRHKACAILVEEFVGERTYEQWGMLQGDSSQADWSVLATKGWSKGHAAGRRARRAGKDKDGGSEEVAREVASGIYDSANLGFLKCVQVCMPPGNAAKPQ